jgi:hypothetical protein
MVARMHIIPQTCFETSSIADLTGSGFAKMKFADATAQLCWYHRREEGMLDDPLDDHRQWKWQLCCSCLICHVNQVPTSINCS